MDIKKITKNILMGIGFLMISHLTVNAGFGVSPTNIDSQCLKPGSSFEQSFTLSRSGNLEEMQITIEPELQEMESWFTYKPGKIFLFPEGSSTKEFSVVVNVPADAEYQNYNGVIRVLSIPTNQAIAGVSITQGVRLDAQLIVTETDFTALSILAISSENTHKRDNIKIDILAENIGNTTVSPCLKVKVQNLLMEVLEEHEVRNFGSVQPNKTETLTAIFSSEVPAGEYFLEATVLLGEQELRTERLVINIEDIPIVEESEEKNEISFFTQIGSIFRSLFSKPEDSLPYILMSLMVFVIVYLLLGKLWHKKEITKATKKKLWAVLLGSKKASRLILSIVVGISTLLLPIVFTSLPKIFTESIKSLALILKETWEYTLISIMLFTIIYLLLEKVWSRKGLAKKAKKTWGIILGSKKLSRLGLSLFLSICFLLFLTLYPLSKDSQEPQRLETSGQTQGVQDTTLGGGVLLYVLPEQVENRYTIYNEPYAESDVVYQAKDGEEFSVVEEREEWFKVAIDFNTTGWLNKTSIKSVTKEEN